MRNWLLVVVCKGIEFLTNHRGTESAEEEKKEKKEKCSRCLVNYVYSNILLTLLLVQIRMLADF
jgi:hypothetical protein